MQEENSLQKKNYWEVGLLNLSLVVWSKWERERGRGENLERAPSLEGALQTTRNDKASDHFGVSHCRWS